MDGMFTLGETGLNEFAFGTVIQLKKCIPESKMLSIVDLFPILEH